MSRTDRRSARSPVRPKNTRKEGDENTLEPCFGTASEAPAGGRVSTGLTRACVALAVACAGCATYRSVAVDDLSPQQRVRVQVEPQVLADLVAFADGPDGSIGGRFVEVRGDSVAFRFETPSSYREVVMPKTAIRRVQRREASRARSVALSVAVVGGIGTLAWLGFEGRGGEGDDLPGDDPDALVPLLFFVVPTGR